MEIAEKVLIKDKVKVIHGLNEFALFHDAGLAFLMPSHLCDS